MRIKTRLIAGMSGASSTAQNNNKRKQNMLSLFRPAPHIDRLPADKVDPFYKRMRWQVFFGIFFGYAGYYPVSYPLLTLPTILRV